MGTGLRWRTPGEVGIPQTSAGPVPAPDPPDSGVCDGSSFESELQLHLLHTDAASASLSFHTWELVPGTVKGSGILAVGL